MQKLFSCLYGSRLYGTQTPTSDLDVKHVVLPLLDSLLLGKQISNKVKKTNIEKNTRNSADDVDEEFIPLQVFARDFINGQTYALELAFAVDGDHAEQTFWYFSAEGNSEDQETYLNDELFPHMFYSFVMELRAKFLTSNVKALMGYAVNQASLYSFKGERLNAARAFKEALMSLWTDAEAGDDPLSDLTSADPWKARFEKLAQEFPKYFKVTTYDIGGGRMMPCFVLLEKTFPWSNTLSHSMKVVDALINKYGSRADSASVDNVDWKATMHALRIVDEGLALLGQGKLVFPFEPEYVQKLLAVKRGEVSLEEVRAELDEKLDKLKELERTTKLPALSQELNQEFEAWFATRLREFYNLGDVHHH